MSTASQSATPLSSTQTSNGGNASSDCASHSEWQVGDEEDLLPEHEYEPVWLANELDLITSRSKEATAPLSPDPSSSTSVGVGGDGSSANVTSGSVERRAFVHSTTGGTPLVIEVAPRVAAINPTPLALKATLKQNRYDETTGEVLLPPGGGLGVPYCHRPRRQPGLLCLERQQQK